MDSSPRESGPIHKYYNKKILDAINQAEQVSWREEVEYCRKYRIFFGVL